MPNICPCCKRRIPAPKAPKQDSRLSKDLGKAENAIAACQAALTNPWFADIRDAVADESARLTRALADHRLLWSLYRRADKGQPYFVEAS